MRKIPGNRKSRASEGIPQIAIMKRGDIPTALPVQQMRTCRLEYIRLATVQSAHPNS
jgi:hypothetical protein